MHPKHLTKGFTLIEVLLVLVIVGFMLQMLVFYLEQRTQDQAIDRTASQMQMVLNAALSYYTDLNQWPNATTLNGSTIDPFQTDYIVNPNLISPWGNQYSVAASSPTPNLFYVYTKIALGNRTYSMARAIEGRLPLAYSSAATGTPPSIATPCTLASTSCFVVATINVPTQNLNNARAVNFAGIYRHGACVPAPACPVDSKGNSMQPQIIVTPTSVSGVGNPLNTSTVYPISSFRAYANTDDGVLDANPNACAINGVETSGGSPCYLVPGGSQKTTGQYWRVCLQVISPSGDVSETNTNTNTTLGADAAWGSKVSVMAMTRCAIVNEDSGSSINVFTR